MNLVENERERITVSHEVLPSDRCSSVDLHILKYLKLFTHVVGCKYFEKEWNVNQPLKLS